MGYPNAEELVRGTGYATWKGQSLGYINSVVTAFANYKTTPIYHEDRGRTPVKFLYSGCKPVVMIDIHSINEATLGAAYINHNAIGRDDYKTGGFISQDMSSTFRFTPDDDKNITFIAEGFCLTEEPLLLSYENLSSLLIVMRCSLLDIVKGI